MKEENKVRLEKVGSLKNTILKIKISYIFFLFSKLFHKFSTYNLFS